MAEGEVTDVQFLCFFCGYAAGETEVTLSAAWVEEGREREQYWAAHRRCMIERMSADVRSYGGPLTGD